MLELSPLVIGACFLIGSLLTFVIFFPRGGRVSPLLASELAQSALMMAILVALCSGAALMFFGYPVGIVIGK
jgi:hypothetical protein